MRLILHKEGGATGWPASNWVFKEKSPSSSPHGSVWLCGLSSTASSGYLWDLKLTTWHYLTLSLGRYSSKLLLPNLFSWHSASALSFIHTQTHIHAYRVCYIHRVWGSRHYSGDCYSPTPANIDLLVWRPHVLLLCTLREVVNCRYMNQTSQFEIPDINEVTDCNSLLLHHWFKHFFKVSHENAHTALQY
jgi:hypothetical protein